jgi:hypothetical protein
MLDYLFIAETYTGVLIRQTPDDKSTLDPFHSAFYDVLQQPVKRFSLIGKGHIFSIDLDDGHVEADGNKLYPPVAINGKLKLIYYRQVQQTIGQPPKITYFFGWEYNDGKNKQWIMGVD